MKSANINGLTTAQQVSAEKPNALRAKSGETRTPSPTSGTPDQVSVSSRADEVNQLIARTNELGDVRQERVDSLRQAVQSGRYQVSSSNIADAIIRDESG
jgi:flagellar biosynthesis anti-sigma factor FlgM